MPRRAPARYTDIERIADALEPGYRRSILRIIVLGPGDPSLQSELRALLRGGQIETALNRAVQALMARHTTVVGALENGLAGGTSRASRVAKFGSQFTASWEPAVLYAQTAAQRTLANIARQAWVSGSELLRRSVEEGWTVSETARRLRQSLGVSQYRMAQINAMRAAGKIPSDAAYDKAMQRAIRHRATMIARTGIMDALNAGQDLAWRKAGLEGHINLDRMERVWTVAYDERLCPICEPLGGMSAPMDGSFNGFQRPPAHAMCRCSLGLRRIRNRV